MISPSLAEEITVGVAAGGVGVYGIRALFAKVATGLARRKAAPAIQELRDSQTNSFAVADEEGRKGPTDILAAIRASERTHRIAETSAANMELSGHITRQSVPDLKKGIENIGLGLIDILKTTSPHKISLSINDISGASMAEVAKAAHEVVADATPNVVIEMANSLKDFSGFTRTHPRLASQPFMRSFLTRVAEAYAHDVKEASSAVHEMCEEKIRMLPKRNWVDVILGIDRRSDIAGLYRKAEQDVTAHLSESSSKLAKVTQHLDPETAIVSILQWPLLKNGKASSAITEGSAAVAAEYSEMLERWENQSLARVSFGLRPTLGKAAIAIALHHAEPAIQEFRNREYGFFAPPGHEHGGIVAEFSDAITKAEEGRKAAVDVAAKMKVPALGKPEPLEELNRDLAGIHTSVTYAFGKTYNRKISKLIKDQVEHRMGKTAEELAEGPPLPLGAVDSGLVSILDGVGAIDVAMSLHEFAASHLSDFALDAADLLGDLLFPGAISGGKALFRETKMLLNNETSIGDSLVHGILPAVAKTGLVGTGAAIDTAFGWTTFGLFTGLGYLASHLVKSTGPQDAIKEDVETLQPYFTQIQTRRNKAVEAINNSVATNFRDFPTLTGSCPAIADEPRMRLFVGQVVEGYAVDARAASRSVDADCLSNIKSLPAPGSLDKVLGIDRSAEVAKLYQSAAGAMTSHLLQLSNEFAHEVQVDPGKLVVALQTRPIFKDGQTIRILTENLPEIEIGYFQSVQQWKLNCIGEWKKGLANVDAISKKENEQVVKLSGDLQPYMAGPRSRIRANLTRLGKDPDLCP